MNQESAHEIWRRVRQPSGLTAEEMILPQQLENAVLEQMGNTACLRRLSGRISGQEQRTLRRLTALQERQVKTLTTLHFYLTGRQLRLNTPALPPAKPLPEELRDACHRLSQAANGYRELASEFAEYEDRFREMEAEARQSNRELMDILRGKLP